jgi:hypothetical protein
MISSVAKTSGTVSVGTSTTTVATQNLGRRELTIVNDGTNIVYLALNTTDGTTVPTAVANSGIRLNASGGSWTTNSYKGPVAGIALVGATGVTVFDI